MTGPIVRLQFAAQLLALVLGPAGVSAADLEVSPDGLSPERALSEARVRRLANPDEPVRVRVRAGLYFLDGPLVLTPEDSGTPVAPVVWIGEAGATFSAGCRVTGWRAEADGSWSAPIPTDKSGERVYAEQMWVNGRRAARSRLPKTGWLKPSSTSSLKTEGREVYVERFSVQDEAARAALASVPDGEWPYAQMIISRKWACARRVVFGYESDAGTLLTRTPLGKTPWQEWGTIAVAAVENVRSAFANPGDWFYDARDGRIRYRPLPGESIDSAEAIVSVAGRSRVLDFCGDCDNGAYVHDIEFRNIAFAHTAIPPAGSPPGEPPIREDAVLAGAPRGATQAYQWQAAVASDGAVSGEGARRIVIDGCRIEHTGNYAVSFLDGCVSNLIVGCRLLDLGAGGIKIGAERGYVPDGIPLSRREIFGLAPRSTAFNVVSNCSVRSTGLVNLEGVGILLTHCSDSKVLNCDLEDLSYTGISVGWVWGYAGSVSQRNEIANNRVGFVGRGVTSDMAGIYTLGCSFGTRIHHNVVHDIESREYGGYGLYCDEGSEGVVMEDNIVWNTTSAGFYMHYGVDNYIRNNVFAWNRQQGSVRMYRPVVKGVRSSLHFVNNIVLTRQAQLCDDKVRTVDGVWANNLWYDVRGEEIARFDRLNWEDWKTCGKESGGRFADPKFVDPEHHDFSLRSNSPAFDLGFRAINLSIGPLDDTERLQSRIDAVWRAGGGTVTVEPGEYELRPIRLRSRVELLLKSGARIYGSRSADDYCGALAADRLERVPAADLQSACGEDLSKRSQYALFVAFGAEDVSVVGEPGSLVDGRNCPDPKGGEGYRGPHTFWFAASTNVAVRGVTVMDSADYAFKFINCRDVRVDRAKVRAGHDGIHFDLCDRVDVIDCDLQTGDDCVAGSGCSDIVVSNCVLNSACSPFRLGGRNVLVTDCVSTGPARFPHRWTLTDAEKARGAAPGEVKGRRSVGCFYQGYTGDIAHKGFYPGNIVIRNTVVRNAERFMVSLSGLPGALWQDGNGISDITFENVTATGLSLPAAVVAKADCPMKIVLRGCSFEFKSTQPCAFFGKNVEVVDEGSRITNAKYLYEERADVSYDDVPEFPSWQIETTGQRATWGLPPLGTRR